MKVLTLIRQSIQSALRFVLESAAQVFSLDHDDYPATGMLPFSGTVYHRHH